MPRTAAAAVLALAGGAAAIWLLFEHAGLDAAITRAFFDPASNRFPLRDNWWFAAAGHTGLKRVTLALWCALAACSLWMPRGLRDWQPMLREAAAGMLVAALLVLWLRGLSAHSCPWDIVGFGGAADSFPLFGTPPANPGPGKCLPAAHASSGFVLFGLYFALRGRRAQWARAALWAAWVLGGIAGLVQVARGAHFTSHILWTAWVAWGATYAFHLAVARVRLLR